VWLASCSGHLNPGQRGTSEWDLQLVWRLKKKNLPLPGIQPQTHKCSATYGTWFSCRLTSVKVILA